MQTSPAKSKNFSHLTLSLSLQKTNRMFKNLQVFRLIIEAGIPVESAESLIAEQRFHPCAPSQEKSYGWIEPRGEAHGALIEAVAGRWLLKFQMETKILPSSVVNELCDEQIRKIEMETGRKPGKKEKREIKDQARSDLLIKAFTKKTSFHICIDRENSILLMDSTSKALIDDAVSSLVKVLPGFSISLLQTNQSHSACMSHWLKENEAPTGFSTDRDCTLKATDESKSVVKYAKHPLDIKEVQEHIAKGKLPTQLALTWKDRMSFTLLDSGAIKKIEYIGVQSDDTEHKDSFDANAAITTGTIGEMLPDLIEALGGEMSLA